MVSGAALAPAAKAARRRRKRTGEVVLLAPLDAIVEPLVYLWKERVHAVILIVSEKIGPTDKTEEPKMASWEPIWVGVYLPPFFVEDNSNTSSLP
jgi:hypothetical protein